MKPAAATQSGTHSGTPDADLAAVVDAWPTLTADARARILAIARGGL